mmetsp:Transcript_45164/g.144670  ORF Transcript_45164/g.144670 Transcript_45164/m.144670 type:complete len:230 (+) Transcript_45164:98-787(+)
MRHRPKAPQRSAFEVRRGPGCQGCGADGACSRTAGLCPRRKSARLSSAQRRAVPHGVDAEGLRPVRRGAERRGGGAEGIAPIGAQGVVVTDVHSRPIGPSDLPMEIEGKALVRRRRLVHEGRLPPRALELPLRLDVRRVDARYHPQAVAKGSLEVLEPIDLHFCHTPEVAFNELLVRFAQFLERAGVFEETAEGGLTWLDEHEAAARLRCRHVALPGVGHHPHPSTLEE